MAENFLTKRQKLKLRQIELYQSPALTNKSDPTHKIAVEELQTIQRELNAGKETESE